MIETGRIELEQQGQYKSMKRWGILLMIPLIIGMIVLCVFARQWRETLKIQKVVVDGSHIVPAQQVFALAKIPLKSSLDILDLFEARQRILQQPFVKSVCINKYYPDAVHIQIIEREPIATVNTGQLRYIDEEAFLLPSIESAVKLDLPIISGVDGIQKAQVGEVIESDELAQAIGLLRTAQQVDSAMYRSISEVNMNSGKDIILYSTDVGVPIIIGRGEYAKKLVILQSFWNNFVKPENAGKLQYVDLRFNEQAVVKWKADSQQTKTTL